MRIAIVADDLTGALDVCAPLAARGLRCHVATSPAGMVAALETHGDVLCVNTASREQTAGKAAAIVRQSASMLATHAAEIVLKKIDSRLKGHVALESAICAEVFGRSRSVLAPAVPAQGRQVRGGHVVGTGLAAPLDIAAALGTDWSFEAPDCITEADLVTIARQDWSKVMLVGASGLSAGLATIVGTAEKQRSIAISGPFLMAIGSHDPITLAQAERVATLSDIASEVSRDGEIAAPAAPVILARADSRPGAPQHSETLARFGALVANRLRRGDIATVLLCGGETAQTVLAALGLDCVEVLGEALPGIAASRALLAGQALTILTKSGGFGTPDDLLLLARSAQQSMRNLSTAGNMA